MILLPSQTVSFFPDSISLPWNTCDDSMCGYTTTFNKRRYILSSQNLLPRTALAYKYNSFCLIKQDLFFSVSIFLPQTTCDSSCDCFQQTRLLFIFLVQTTCDSTCGHFLEQTVCILSSQYLPSPDNL